MHAAVAAALVGLAAVSTQVQAQPALSDTNTGQALIYPYFTVNDGWITTLNLMNTSEKTLAVKVRFHETKNSRDVLDFVIIMSPFDSWTGWVEDSDLGTRIRTVDNSCTSPVDIDGANASSIAYTGPFNDTGGSGLNRMREGYVEVLVMGVATATAQTATPPTTFDAAAAFAATDSLYVPYFSEHVDGVPRNCAIADRAFIAKSPNWTAPDLPTDAKYTVNLACAGTGPSTALPGSGYPLASCDFEKPAATDNPLKGNVGWLNAGTGYGAGSEAIAVQEWATGAFVTAQMFPWFLEPTFATATNLWTIDPKTFEDTVTASATMNEWADNPNNGARSDWVIAFPTKSFHVDVFNDQIQAANNKYRTGGLANSVTCTDPLDRTTCNPDDATKVAPFEVIFGKETADDGTGTSPITVVWDLYDREEGTVVFESSGTSISPAPPPDVEIDALLYEANVVQFSDSGSVFGSNFPAVLSASAALNGAGSGWAKATFVNDALPVGAFAIRSIDRTLDGQAYDAGYERPTTP
jgi:hypothetical protein